MIPTRTTYRAIAAARPAAEEEPSLGTWLAIGVWGLSTAAAFGFLGPAGAWSTLCRTAVVP